MDINTLGNIGSFLQGLSALATPIVIYFAFKEIRGARQENELQGYYRTVDMMIQLDQFFIEHPDYREYIYEGKAFNRDELSNQTYDSLMAVAEMMSDFFDIVLQQLDIMEVDRATAWVNYILETGEQSPLIRKFILENHEWYIDCLVDMLVKGEYIPHQTSGGRLKKGIKFSVTHKDGDELDRIRADLQALKRR